jgi:DNA repair protein RadA
MSTKKSIEEQIKEKRASQEETQKEIAKIYGTDEMKVITKKLEKLTIKPVVEPRTSLSDANLPKLLTGTILDDILGRGGISAGKLVELYGEYGSGKTQILFTLTAEASQRGTVVFNDCEYTFSSDRLEQICKERGLDIDKMWKNIIVYQPEDWMHQLASIQQIPSPSDLASDGREPLQLIVVDSLLALIDASEDFEGRQNLPVRSRVIRTQILGKLRQLARTHNCVVVFSNQIQDVPDVKPFTPFYLKQKAKGGPTVSHVPDIILYLRKSAGDTRIARLMDSSTIETAERVYCINKKGIDDVPAPIKQKIENASKKEDEKEVQAVDAEVETEEPKVEEE